MFNKYLKFHFLPRCKKVLYHASVRSDIEGFDSMIISSHFKYKRLSRFKCLIKSINIILVICENDKMITFILYLRCCSNI